MPIAPTRWRAACWRPKTSPAWPAACAASPTSSVRRSAQCSRAAMTSMPWPSAWWLRCGRWASQAERVVAGGVGEPAAHLQLGVGVDPLETLAGELGGDLGAHLLAGGEGDRHLQGVEPDRLLGERAQADVHARLFGVVAGDVLEGLE